MSGIGGLRLENIGDQRLTLKTIEASLRDGGRQLGWDSRDGLVFGPGDQVELGLNNKYNDGPWDWTDADTLIFNGDFEQSDGAETAEVLFHLEPIEICSSNTALPREKQNKNPIGWEGLSLVHAVGHNGYVDNLSMAVVAILGDDGTVICHDGLTRCSQMDHHDDHHEHGHWHVHWHSD